MTSMCPPIDPTVSVVLTWTDPDTDLPVTLTLDPELPTDPTTPWFWSALSWPFFDYAYTYAPASRWLPGQVLLAAVPQGAAIPIGITLTTDPADGQAGLGTARNTVEAAFRAVDLTLTFTVDGTTIGTWAADPARVNWGQVLITTLGMFAQEGTVAVPVNPVEAT